MSLPARKLEAEEFMAEHTVLDERVEHIQNDVAEIKKDIRRLDEKIDAVNDKIDAVKAEVGTVRMEVANLRTEMKESIGEVKTQIALALGTTKASENALIKWMTGVVLSAIGVASAIAFGIAKLVH